MLTSDLLVVSKKKGNIQPRYAKLSDRNLEIANKLIQAYKNHVGKKRGSLKERISELEKAGYDYRFVRGLALLLDRRSKFKCGVDFDPANLRREVFHEVTKQGIPTTAKSRSRIMERTASETRWSVEIIEDGLYADLEGEMILKEFNAVSNQKLLKNYNLSLTQTLLFNSTELSFTASGNWQRIFHTVKSLGLIYEVFKKKRSWISIDGPVSLFKLTRRYGTALAKLLPTIIANKKWRVKGKILWKYNNQIYNFKIDSTRHGKVFGNTRKQKVSFDSRVEREFAIRFQALDSNWKLKREPEPIPAGRYVIIPDFSFQRKHIKVFMEIMGFWTREYLRRKIKKLEDMEVNMLIAVDENLACEKLERMEKSGKIKIVYYKKKVPLSPIIRYLEKAFEEIKEKQIKFLRNLPIKFEVPVVNYQDFAHRIGVSTEAVRKTLTTKHPKNYIPLSNTLVKKDKLEEIKNNIEERISQRGKISLPEVTKVIEQEGIQNTSNILKYLGYQIKWKGINSKKAEVIKLDEN